MAQVWESGKRVGELIGASWDTPGAFGFLYSVNCLLLNYDIITLYYSVFFFLVSSIFIFITYIVMPYYLTLSNYITTYSSSFMFTLRNYP